MWCGLASATNLSFSDLLEPHFTLHKPSDGPVYGCGKIRPCANVLKRPAWLSAVRVKSRKPRETPETQSQNW